MAKKSEYTIRKRGNGWQANLSRSLTGGKRIQIYRSLKADVEAEAKRQLQSLTEYGSDYLNFSPEQLRACAEAIRKLQEHGFKPTAISDAVDYFTEHNDPNATRKKISDILNEFLVSKNSAGLSEFTLSDYRQKLTRFSNSFGKRYIHTISPSEIEEWLDSVNARGTTRQDYQRHLSIFWRYAIARKYTRENAAAAVTKVKSVRKSPAILTPDDVRRLLNAARDYNDGCMLAYFAIGCFCGLRPWELRRTEWSNINFDTKEIYVSQEACKTAEDRFVSMPECLLAWLQKYPKAMRSGPVFFSRTVFNNVREKAGMLKLWDKDVMRHSAASHLYAQTQNSGQVTAQMGHGLNVFMRYYKRAVTQSSAITYFNVFPDEGDVVMEKKG